MISKVFLALVGLMYLGLAIWCTVSPVVTSQKVGFDVKPGSGQSEYLVIYGGLELGLAMLFLLPLINTGSLQYSLLACILIHGCLVAFRTASLFVYSDFEKITYSLAIGEWIILMVAVMCYFINRMNFRLVDFSKAFFDTLR